MIYSGSSSGSVSGEKFRIRPDPDPTLDRDPQHFQQLKLMRIRIHNPAPGSTPQPPVDQRGQPETQSPPEDRVGNKKTHPKKPKKTT